MSETVNNEKRRKRRVLIIGAVVVVIAGLIVFLGNRGSAEAGDGMTEAAVTTMTIENTLEFDGEIVSSLEEDVLPHTSYYLDEIKVEEGQAVLEGGTILSYTNGDVMTAPYNCVVRSWDLPDEGEQLTSDHYVTIAGTDVMQMEISVNESDVSKLKVGDEATVVVDSAESTYPAEVSYISQAGEYSGGSSTFAAELTFENDGKLKLGMSGSATVALEKAEDVLALPVAAVSTKGGTSYVTLKDGTESGTLTEVETGISNGSFIEIKNGLSEGDTVIYKVQESSSSDQGGRGGHDGMGGGPDGMQGGGGMPGGSSGGGAPGGSGSGDRQRPQ